jgi:membrane protein implicated in regulation of membrane protease activity
MYFVVPVILGSSVGTVQWLGIGFFHTLLFALAFCRDYKRRLVIAVIATIFNIAIILFLANFFLGVSMLLSIMVVPMPVHMIIFMVSSFVATIFTCSSPRKYVTTIQSPDEESNNEINKEINKETNKVTNIETNIENNTEKSRIAILTKRPIISILCAVILVMILNIGVEIGSNVYSNTEEDVFAIENFTENPGSLTYLSSNATHGQIAVDYLEFINDNVRDRFPFSYGERDAAVWIVEELLAMGYDMEAITVQEFDLTDANIALEGGMLEGFSLMPLFYNINSSPFMNLDLRRSERSQNVILTVPGVREEVLLVAAHYDAPLEAAISDNASGVALLLESAKRLLDTNNEYTITYVFLGAEEVGLLGVYYYLASLTGAELENIKFAVNADVLLEGEALFVARGHYADGILSENDITNRWDEIVTDVNMNENANLLPWLNGIFITSDNLAFLEYELTTMFLMGLCLDYVGDGWRDMERGMLGLVDITEHNMGTILHTRDDNVAFINETWPGMMDNNMRVFSIYLEHVLFTNYE